MVCDSCCRSTRSITIRIPILRSRRIIPDGSGGATQFSVLTEEQVLQATKEAMGQNQVDIVEALVLADMDLLLNPITVGGAPWQPPPPI